MLYHRLKDFIKVLDFANLTSDEHFLPGQFGHYLQADNDLDQANLVLLGVNDWRGAGWPKPLMTTSDVRRALYQLYFWHTELHVADAGDLLNGATRHDTNVALQTVLHELLQAGKRVLIFGGSHDITDYASMAFGMLKQNIEVTVVDALIDIHQEDPLPAKRFLLDMVTRRPNYVQHLNLLGFQSYLTYPNLLETIDKLRFDCHRVGKVQEQMEEMEPNIRGSELFSFDMHAIAHAYAPANALSPNGLTGSEACRLMQFAGMSQMNRINLLSLPCGKDHLGMTAMQAAHMIWYFVDGMQRLVHEKPITALEGYNEFHTLCAELDTLFLQSRNTGRWWMQMPDKSFVPCSYQDYLAASRTEIPERWLRKQERL